MRYSASMDVVVRIQGQEFEWDEEKARANAEKHGVTFDEAAEAFFDPFYQTGRATPPEAPEERQFVLGYSASLRLLLVIYVERSVRLRIISARPATRAERRIYESS